MNTTIEKIVDKTLGWCLMGILIASMLAFPVCNIVMMYSYPDTFSCREWVWVLVALVLIWIVWKAGRGWQIGRWKVSPFTIGFIISNISFVIVLITYDTKPASDWAAVWKAANEMADGTFIDGIVTGTYMHEIPYQLGLAFVESLFIRIGGSSYWILKIFNLFLLNIITWSTYHFAKRKASEEVANFAYMAACTFLCYLMTVGQFTNHQLGFVFLYLSLYLYEKGKFFWCCCAGVTVACLNFVRPMGIMVVASAIVYTLYLLLTKRGKVRMVLLNFVGFYLCFKIFLFLFDSMLLGLSYTDEYVSKSSRNLYHKITYTTYESKVDGTLADYHYDYEAYNKAYREEIVNMLVNHPTEIAVSVINKMTRYLGMLDYLFEMTYDHDESVWMKYPVKAIYSTQWFQYLFLLLIAAYGFWNYRKTHKIDIYHVFFVGNTLVYFFVEAFSAYRFVNYFYILFLVGYGLNTLALKSKIQL